MSFDGAVFRLFRSQTRSRRFRLPEDLHHLFPPGLGQVIGKESAIANDDSKCHFPAAMVLSMHTMMFG